MGHVLSSYFSNPDQVYRRNQLRNLDLILTDLETINLREGNGIPHSLHVRLREAGVSARADAAASELIDLVFRAQETYLQPPPDAATRRRKAA
ncbi:MAG: hypothetical protein NVSMB17_02090 [Candidatus Dormibacteria bacterium]